MEALKLSGMEIKLLNNYCTRALLDNTNQTTVQTVHKYVKLVFDTRLPPSFNDISDDR